MRLSNVQREGETQFGLRRVLTYEFQYILD